MGSTSQKRGNAAQQLVLADLLKQGHTGQIQQQRCIVLKTGRRVYPDPQGCDIIGGTSAGKAMFIEVKAYAGKSIRISQRDGITLRQLAFMLDKESRGFAAYFAFVSPDNTIWYVQPHKITDRAAPVYLLENASVDGAETIR